MSGLFRSLRVRNYRLFASGQVVSLTGTWMNRVAQDWLVLQLSHGSGTALGITTGLQFLPMLLFSLYGGLLADRYPKRRLLLATQTAMGFVAITLGLLDATGVVALWHVFALAFALGLCSAVDNPVRQAFVVELVGPDDVPNAVSLNSATFNTARLIGPAVAGLLINVAGTSPVFFINAGSYLAVLTGLAMMRDRELHLVRKLARTRGQLREGLRYVRARPDLLFPIILVGIVGTFGLNFQITTALMATHVFGKGAGGYGLLGTALALGSLTGALLSARRGRPRQILLLGSALAFGLAEVVVGLMPTYWTFALVLIPCGALALTFTTAANSTMQLGSSAGMRGRVMALYMVVFVGGAPIGSPVIGWLAEVLGARSSLLIGGAIVAAATVAVGGLLIRSRQLRIEPHLLSRHPHLHVRPSRPVSRSREATLDEVRRTS